ncbi:MAG: PolC-type DNA polymerase III [Firmicutes bacterium]|nr:PolC-type DNA polymerase III [Bacillota bacterium]
MNKTPFNQLIQEHLPNDDIEIKKIEYRREESVLSIRLRSNKYVAGHQLDGLKNILKTHLAFVNDFEIEVETPEDHQPINTSPSTPQANQDTGFMENWDNILMVIRRKNPAVASILKRSKIAFNHGKIHIIFDDKGLENTFYQYKTDEMIQMICDRNLGKTFELQTESLKDEVDGYEDFDRMQDETIESIVAMATNGFSEEAIRQSAQKKEESVKSVKSNAPEVLYRNKIKRSTTKIIDINQEEETYAIEGKLVNFEARELKGGKFLLKLYLSDLSNAVACKQFLKKKEYEDLLPSLKQGKWYIVEGINRYDQFDKESVLLITAINVGKEEIPRVDLAEEKRVELHLHTNMSEMDGIAPVKKIIQTAIDWGHPAIAITDHGVLQAFPDAASAAGDKIKVIYGLEGYLIDDEVDLIVGATDYGLDETFVVFDIETTGFSYHKDTIIEIGAVKVEKGVVTERFSQLINPLRPIPPEISELTGISEDMVSDQPSLEEVLPRFMAFIEGAPVVAHNANFDCSFIRYYCEKLALPFTSLIVDTLALSRLLLTDIKKHNLKAVTKYLKIVLNDHHRAVADAEATARVFVKFTEMLNEREVFTLKAINRYFVTNFDFTQLEMSHVILLAQTQPGLRNLYEIVSHSNLNTYYRKPRIPKSLLRSKREGLLIGSACEAGELYKAIMSNQTPERVLEIADFYDYLEIQPADNNAFMLESGKIKHIDEIKTINRHILHLGDKLGKTVVATGDVHFINPEDEVYRRILMAGNGYNDADNQAPLYFRTTNEMLEAFDYLGDRAREVVIDNPKKLADACEMVRPVPKGTFPPVIEGADEEFREMCMAKAKRIYGDDLPEIVEKRLLRELNSIIGNGYAVMYIIAQKLVTKSLEDGFLVGSRGSVGSSLAATMSDITEVNPLPPHYICKNCKHSEFFTDGKYGAGVDMPDKICPECGTKYFKDGYDIPFETFLGFDGDKEPDIDLNFAGIYQANAHKYCEVLFGKGKTFKAGTIGTIADKTAYGYVKKYFEERQIDMHRYEIERLAQGLTGVKRTSGQHPGGIMVVPADRDIHEFCPIQYPANDVTSDVITTHFDYHSISGRLLKLDILGHDVPTIIKYLEELTGLNVFDIPLDDAATMKIFTSADPLGIKDASYSLDIGSLGIPEFGTKFVRQMLRDTNPQTFSDLVRISGLSHGTDVWVNNAQDLVRNNTVTIKEVIATRDDIMNYLIQMKLEPLTAFKIMENVRKGKGLKEDEIKVMKENNVPDWYINSCQTIQYMFPKAHAVAYVMMSVRIAYFKVHQPLAFYATYFTTKVDDFDAELICKGNEVVRAKMKEIDGIEKPTKKEQDLQGILEIVDEMYSRGFGFKKVSLMESDAESFKIVDGKILPPFLALQGVGASAAQSIAAIRDEHREFLSVEDFQRLTKVSKTVIEAMKVHGCFDELPDDNQLTLFSFA